MFKNYCHRLCAIFIPCGFFNGKRLGQLSTTMINRGSRKSVIVSLEEENFPIESFIVKPIKCPTNFMNKAK